MSTRRMWVWSVFACVLLAAAFAMDAPVGQWLFEHHWHDKSYHIAKGTLWATVLKWPGDYRTTLVLAAIVVLSPRFALRDGIDLAIHGVADLLRHPARWLLRSPRLAWRRGVVLLVCGAAAILNDPMKWVFGRPRPVNDKLGQLTSVFQFDFFRGGVRGLFHTGGLAFPSGHTMLAFATATCLARYYPKWAWLCFAVASAVGVERVLEMAHHPSDVVAAAIGGVLLSQACMKLLRNWANPLPEVQGSEALPVINDLGKKPQ